MDSMNQPPTYMTVAETAVLLRTTPKAVYVMVERGLLPAVHLGRRLLFSRERLIAFLERRTR